MKETYNTPAEMALNNARYFATFAIHMMEIVNIINEERFLEEDGKTALLINIQNCLNSLQLEIPYELQSDGLFCVNMLRTVGKQLEELNDNFMED